MTRRRLALLAAAAPAIAQAQTAPAGPAKQAPDDLTRKKEQLKRTSDALARIQLPFDQEPQFRFEVL